MTINVTPRDPRRGYRDIEIPLMTTTTSNDMFVGETRPRDRPDGVTTWTVAGERQIES